MDIRSLPSNIEIAFWSVIISLLTDSELIQGFVQKYYYWLKSGRWVRTLRWALILSAVGFLLGILVGLAGF